jgi:hypothetical protein
MHYTFDTIMSFLFALVHLCKEFRASSPIFMQNLSLCLLEASGQ